MKMVKTDILIIGGGGAGLRAALSAREEGGEVVLVAKTPIGKSTCTQLSGGAFAVAAGGLSQDEHFDATIRTGRGLNHREFVHTVVNDSPERIREMERLGLVGEWRRGRFTTRGKAPSWGTPIVEVLKETAEKQGISLLPWIMIFHLVKEGGRIAGALGSNIRNGERIAFTAKAVILANGGGGALYPRNDNPVRATGDGYALAYHAGCALRDMEFVQFIPEGLAEPGKPAFLLAPTFADAGMVINSRGEDVLKKYHIVDRPVAVRCRDTFSQAIALEEDEGNGVYLDLRGLTDETWPKDNMARSQRHLLERNLSSREKILRIFPTCHFFMGGVATDLDGRTGIPGLYAAGEVVGGLHGANRMGGNALSEVFVFGHRTGKEAGRWVKDNNGTENSNKTILPELELADQKLRNLPKGTPSRELRRKIGKILWDKVGIIRDKTSLQSAIETIAEMRGNDLLGARSATPKEMLEKLELENALLVGEMISRSALLREETRGAHYRRDFPQGDDAKWKGNIFLRESNTDMVLKFKPLS
jgi:fumarate reductase (CoM/CoB) subunit A